MSCAEQKRRILRHITEAITDAHTEHNPYHMLVRAIGVAAVCTRRLLECRLVTDRFRDFQLDVHRIRVKQGIEWREPFVSRMASEIFNNYDLKERYLERRTPKKILGQDAPCTGDWRAFRERLPAGRPADRLRPQRRPNFFTLPWMRSPRSSMRSWMTASRTPQTDISTTENCSARTRYSRSGREGRRLGRDASAGSPKRSATQPGSKRYYLPLGRYTAAVDRGAFCVAP